MEKSNQKVTEHSGVIIREDISMLVWSDDTRIEVLLTPEQAIQLAQELYDRALMKDDYEE